MSQSDSEQDSINVGSFGYYKKDDETLPQATLRYFKTGTLYYGYDNFKDDCAKFSQRWNFVTCVDSKVWIKCNRCGNYNNKIGIKYLMKDKSDKQLEHSNVDVSGE